VDERGLEPGLPESRNVVVAVFAEETNTAARPGVSGRASFLADAAWWGRRVWVRADVPP
jgi:hypothetical protein